MRCKGNSRGTGLWTSGLWIASVCCTLGVFAPRVIEALPEISVSTSLSFGNADTGTAVQETLAVSSTGDTTLTVTGITLAGTNPGQFSFISTPFEVAAGQSRMVIVTFSPTAAGNKSAFLSLAHNAALSPTQVALSGTGVQPTVEIT